MNPWCTVLVPLFNGGKYLRQCISALSISLNSGCTCLVIDDASTDGTYETMLASGLPRMRLIRNDRNLGLYACINKGLDTVDTDYVSLIFQDDVVEAGYFWQMRRLISTHSAASFFWAAITVIDDAGDVLSEGLNTGRVEVISPGVEPWRSAVRRGTFWTISGSVSKTERLRHYGFRSDLPHCADYDFLLRAIREETFLYLEKSLTKIRAHDGQASAHNLAKSLDLLERAMIYSEQKRKFPGDFDLSLRLFTCRKEMLQASRRALGQVIRGDFRQAFSTAMLAPEIIRATLL